MTAPTIGFIGLGAIGMPMALNLLRDGYDVTAYDVSADPMRVLAAAGGHAVTSVREVGARASMVEVMVFDDAQVESVISGDDGLLGTMAPGGAIAIHSTIRPANLRRIADVARNCGINVGILDAPLSGTPRGAADRTLSFMVGGDDATVERFRPILTVSGSRIFHFGVLGAGLIAKLAHQVILALNFLGAAEGFGLAGRAGLDLSMLQAAIHDSRAQSLIADEWADLKPGSHGALIFVKDLTIALEIADEFGLSLPAVTMARDLIPVLMGAVIGPVA